jgi:beta-glucosidase
VHNTGSQTGAEVVELYVHEDHAQIDRPVHELKAFQRVELQPGETKTVEFTLNRPALSYWDPKSKDWQIDPGTFEVQIGASSRDIRLRAPLRFGQ